MLSALDVARFFVERANAEADDNDMTHLKLQKLCYYAEGFSWAVLGRPLFRQPLEAWREGPVVREVYNAYRQYGSARITEVQGGGRITDQDALDIMEAVYDYYGQFSAWTLRNRTHREPPWLEARPTEGNLRPETMTAFFRTQLGNIDDSSAVEHEAIQQVLRRSSAFMEGTLRGRDDALAGRVKPIRG